MSDLPREPLFPGQPSGPFDPYAFPTADGPPVRGVNPVSPAGLGENAPEFVRPSRPGSRIGREIMNMSIGSEPPEPGKHIDAPNAEPAQPAPQPGRHRYDLPKSPPRSQEDEPAVIPVPIQPPDDKSSGRPEEPREDAGRSRAADEAAAQGEFTEADMDEGDKLQVIRVLQPQPDNQQPERPTNKGTTGLNKDGEATVEDEFTQRATEIVDSMGEAVDPNMRENFIRTIAAVRRGEALSRRESTGPTSSPEVLAPPQVPRLVRPYVLGGPRGKDIAKEPTQELPIIGETTGATGQAQAPEPSPDAGEDTQDLAKEVAGGLPRRVRMEQANIEPYTRVAAELVRPQIDPADYDNPEAIGARIRYVAGLMARAVAGGDTTDLEGIARGANVHLPGDFSVEKLMGRSEAIAQGVEEMRRQEGVGPAIDTDDSAFEAQAWEAVNERLNESDSTPHVEGRASVTERPVTTVELPDEAEDTANLAGQVEEGSTTEGASAQEDTVRLPSPTDAGPTLPPLAQPADVDVAGIVSRTERRVAGVERSTEPAKEIPQGADIDEAILEDVLSGLRRLATSRDEPQHEVFIPVTPKDLEDARGDMDEARHIAMKRYADEEMERINREKEGDAEPQE